jgi:hypothetical protein
MKLPGRAWLEFSVIPQPEGHAMVRCCAWFEPRGLLGELYWWALYPIHIAIFRGMMEAVCKAAAVTRSDAHRLNQREKDSGARHDQQHQS